MVVDWKSDVAPVRETLKHYCAQVRAYLDMTQAERGLIVLATSGTVIPVGRANPAVAVGLKAGRDAYVISRLDRFR